MASAAGAIGGTVLSGVMQGLMQGGSDSSSISGGDQFTTGHSTGSGSNWGWGSSGSDSWGSTGPMWRKQRKGLKKGYKRLVGADGGQGLMDQAMPEVDSVEELLAGFTPDTLEGFKGVRDAGGYLSGGVRGAIDNAGNRLGDTSKYLDQIGKSIVGSEVALNQAGSYLDNDVAKILKDFQGKNVNVDDTYEMTKGYAEDVISGKYLNPETNQALQNYMDINYKKTLGGVNALAGKYGAFGGSDWGNARQRAGNELAASTYQGERERQQQGAASFLPMLQGYKQNVKSAAGADLAAANQHYGNLYNQFQGQRGITSDKSGLHQSGLQQYGAEANQANMQRQHYYDQIAQAQSMMGIGDRQQRQAQAELDANRYLLKYPTQEARDRLNWSMGLLGQDTGRMSRGGQAGWNTNQGGYNNIADMWKQVLQSPNVSKSSSGK